VRPPLFPFDDPHVHDSDQILEISELPGCIAVVGAGVVGAEYACTFAALGVQVHIVDGRASLLPFLDAEISAAIAAGMKRAGVQFHWGKRVVDCSIRADGRVCLRLSDGETLVCTDVLVAAGRSRNTGALDLAAAGVADGKRGLIPVNAHYQSSVPHIYAAGDVIGAPALAATAMEQGRAAACHAFGVAKGAPADLLPTGIYCIPEASMCGLTEEQVRLSGVSYLVGRARYRDNPRGLLVGDPDGLLKLIFRRGDMRLLGVHVVGEQATELVHIGMIALLAGADVGLFDRACFNYPTLGDLYKHAAYDALAQNAGPPGTPAL
jgi:NAD(P) transhydrogenase